jgi:hypothetical protein
MHENEISERVLGAAIEVHRIFRFASPATLLYPAGRDSGMIDWM